jgi:DNA invertase Pin-like site-specific DNA recombinase
MKRQRTDNQREAITWGRFSSDKQGDGDSRDRQDRLNRALAKRQGLRVVAEYFDPAASVKDGATEKFKTIIASLPGGVGIITENLDRISRGHPWRAKAYIADILEAGHFIITSSDGREYTSESIEDISTLVAGDMATNVARYENNKRTERVREEKAKAIELARQGIPVPLGAWLPPHIKYNFETKQYDIRQDRLEIVQRIFSEYAAGKGVTSIAKGLNKDKVATFRFKKVGGWSKVTIFTMLRYEGLLGVMNYLDERIPKAFPPAIDEKIFYRVQEMLKQNKVRHGKYSADNVRNIFRGVCHCAKCGVSMRVLNGDYLQCGGVQVGKCDIKHVVKFSEMEFEFIQWFVFQAKNALLGRDGNQSAIETLASKQVAIQERIRKTIDLLDAGLAVSEIKERLTKLEAEKSQVANQISESKSKQSSDATLPDTIKRLEAMIDDCQTNQETRRKVAALVPSIVEDVRVDLSDKWFPSFEVHLVNGDVKKWEYSIDEFAQPIIGFTKDGQFVLGKGRVTEGGFTESK